MTPQMSSDLWSGLICFSCGILVPVTWPISNECMNEKRTNILLGTLLLVALLVLGLDKIAQDNFLYWTYWWYDIMMHFLGGFLVAGIALWFFLRFFRPDFKNAKCAFTVAVATGIIVGIGWEFFEYFSGALLQQEGSIVGDTALDLVMDTVGACAVWAIISGIFFKRSEAQTITS